MSPELQQKLFDKYPKIFRDRTKPMTETCMCWGLEIGDGWYQIIDGLCAAIDHPYGTGVEIDGEYMDHECPQVVADQVKEKYSSLRYYFHLEHTPETQAIYDKSPEKGQQLMSEFDRYVDGAVAMAESMSMITCEVTGRPGESLSKNGSPHGWLKTLCPEEAERQGYKKIEPAKDDAT